MTAVIVNIAVTQTPTDVGVPPEPEFEPKVALGAEFEPSGECAPPASPLADNSCHDQLSCSCWSSTNPSRLEPSVSCVTKVSMKVAEKAGYTTCVGHGLREPPTLTTSRNTAWTADGTILTTVTVTTVVTSGPAVGT